MRRSRVCLRRRSISLRCSSVRTIGFMAACLDYLLHTTDCPRVRRGLFYSPVLLRRGYIVVNRDGDGVGAGADDPGVALLGVGVVPPHAEGAVAVIDDDRGVVGGQAVAPVHRGA